MRKSEYKKTLCHSCLDWLYMRKDSEHINAKLCKECFDKLTPEEKRIALGIFYIPCMGCDGQFYQQNYLGEIEYCDQCGGSGRQQVTKEEYDRFWRTFSKDDFI
ncbi:hypothetical protein NXG04_07515 [Klebsiella pneumoniae]|nr:hypothetical protein [Klebsiella pneumoniae]MDS7714401.1 hypothetical protein [Klebsiella pneumoniae]